MSESLWSRLLGREQSRQQTLEERWQGLVKAIADGKEPAADAVEHVLDAAGKTVEDLRKAVDLLTRRRAARAAVDRGKLVPIERDKTEQLLIDANARCVAAIEAAHHQCAATRAPLEDRFKQLDAIDKVAGSGASLLEETADNPAALAEISALEASLAEARLRQGAAARAAYVAQCEALDCRRQVERAMQGGRVDGKACDALEKKAKVLDQEEKRQRALAEDVEPECRQLQAQIDALQQSLLEP
jgi:hypothetical protein